MRLGNTLLAELLKTATLRATWASVAVTVLGSAGIAVLNAVSTRSALEAGEPHTRAFLSPFETAYAGMPFGVAGAIVLGVVTISSEYTANSADAGGGRQITATLAAVPHRVGLLAVKAFTVVLLVTATAAVTVLVCAGVARVVIGDAAAETVTLGEALTRSLGAALFWTLMGLMALAVTTLTRSGVLPLLVFVANSSLVSFSLLLTKLTPLAHWLPDMAGRRLFGGLSMVEGGPDAVPGALVMGAWAAGLLAVAAVVLARRDA